MDHSFSNLYQRTAIIGKALETRWFHHDNDPVTRMPFLRRSLNYPRCDREHEHERDVSGDSDGDGEQIQQNFKLGHSKRRRRNRLQSSPGCLESSGLSGLPIEKTKGGTVTGSPSPSKDTQTRTLNIDILQTVKIQSNPKLSKHLQLHPSSILKLTKRFPPYIPYQDNQWIKPHPPSTALQLLQNKVQNSRNFTKINQSAILHIWDELEDKGKFWVEEATWDYRRYRYQKALFDNAKYEARKGSAVFSYFYYDDFGQMRVQLEQRNDRRCPFCWFDGVDDYGLMMHCKTVHEDDFLFEDVLNCDDQHQHQREGSRRKIRFDAGVDGDNNLHVTVKSLRHPHSHAHRGRQGNHNHTALRLPRTTGCARGNITVTDKENNFQFLRCVPVHNNSDGDSDGNKRYVDDPLRIIPLVQMPNKITCLLDSKTRKRKIKQLDQQAHYNTQIQEFAKKQFIADDKAPIRQYYHSKTMQPMAAGEWDEDSDEEADDSWSKFLSEVVLRELGDVSPREKTYMNLWNRFMESHTVVADTMLPDKCEDFLGQFHGVLIEKDLRHHFLLHLLNLWDNQLISSNRIMMLMKSYEKYETYVKTTTNSLAVSKSNSRYRDEDHGNGKYDFGGGNESNLIAFADDGVRRTIECDSGQIAEANSFDLNNPKNIEMGNTKNDADKSSSSSRKQPDAGGSGVFTELQPQSANTALYNDQKKDLNSSEEVSQIEVLSGLEGKSRNQLGKPESNDSKAVELKATETQDINSYSLEESANGNTPNKTKLNETQFTSIPRVLYAIGQRAIAIMMNEKEDNEDSDAAATISSKKDSPDQKLSENVAKTNSRDLAASNDTFESSTPKKPGCTPETASGVLAESSNLRNTSQVSSIAGATDRSLSSENVSGENSCESSPSKSQSEKALVMIGNESSESSGGSYDFIAESPAGDYKKVDSMPATDNIESGDSQNAALLSISNRVDNTIAGNVLLTPTQPVHDVTTNNVVQQQQQSLLAQQQMQTQLQVFQKQQRLGQLSHQSNEMWHRNVFTAATQGKGQQVRSMQYHF